METAAPQAFAGGIRRAAFVPFAAMVHGALGFDLEIASRRDDLAAAQLIIVGGGNTFQLLRECRSRGLLDQCALHQRVASRPSRRDSGPAPRRIRTRESRSACDRSARPASRGMVSKATSRRRSSLQEEFPW
jgi:hypothetical protein